MPSRYYKPFSDCAVMRVTGRDRAQESINKYQLEEEYRHVPQRTHLMVKNA